MKRESRFIFEHSFKMRPMIPVAAKVSRRARRLSLSDQYSRIAMSKYHVRRISITSNSLARAGGNTW